MSQARSLDGEDVLQENQKDDIELELARRDEGLRRQQTDEYMHAADIISCRRLPTRFMVQHSVCAARGGGVQVPRYTVLIFYPQRRRRVHVPLD